MGEKIRDLHTIKIGNANILLKKNLSNTSVVFSHFFFFTTHFAVIFDISLYVFVIFSKRDSSFLSRDGSFSSGDGSFLLKICPLLKKMCPFLSLLSQDKNYSLSFGVIFSSTIFVFLSCSLLVALPPDLPRSGSSLRRRR